MPNSVRRRHHPWADAPILVKGFLVVVLPVLMLTLSSGAVFITGNAHLKTERQRVAAESVRDAIRELRHITSEGPALILLSSVSGTPADIAAAQRDWQQEVRTLDLAAQAQSDQVLRRETKRVQEATNVISEVLNQVVAAPEISTGLTPQRIEQINDAIGTITTATDRMALRADSIAASYTHRYQHLSRIFNLLLLIGTPLGIAGALLGMLALARSIVTRVRQLEVNADALGDGAPLSPLDHASDELGQLGQGLDRAGALLRDREDTLRQSEERLALALDAGGFGSWSVDLAAGTSTWSERCEAVHDLAPGGFGGTFDAWLDLVHVDDRAAILAAGDTANDDGQWTAEYRIIPADGGVRWVETHAQNVTDDDGGVIGLVGLASDVTERHRVEVALRDLIIEAERANAAKSEFLSRVSHEFRTPLNAILGFGQLLQMEELTESQAESVGQVLRGGRHLLAVIDDVLDVSRIESGTLSMSIEPVGLADLLRDAIALVTPLAGEHDVRIDQSDLPDEDLHVLADRRRLKQIILNLASNAIKFNRPGGRVSFRCSVVEPDRVRLDVIDTGCGISDDVLHRLFTPFDRLGAEHTTVDGTGIGLALSQRLAEAQGGTISVVSVQGQGSTFSVDLAHAKAGWIPDEMPNHDPFSVPGEGPGGSVLYIEDNPSNVTLVQRVLERRPDIRLTVARTGAMGLSVAARIPFDAILLDLHLPDVDGEEVLRQLRASPATDTPVIVLSADATPSHIERLREAGVVEYLTKPLDLPHFLRVLDDLLAGVRA
jgi:PAS domain S-box-containing protein